MIFFDYVIRKTPKFIKSSTLETPKIKLIEFMTDFQRRKYLFIETNKGVAFNRDDVLDLLSRKLNSHIDTRIREILPESGKKTLSIRKKVDMFYNLIVKQLIYEFTEGMQVNKLKPWAKKQIDSFIEDNDDRIDEVIDNLLISNLEIDVIEKEIVDFVADVFPDIASIQGY